MAKSEWYQGTFIPQHPEKCINKTAIEYRSSWEKRFLCWLDENPSVKKYGYEVVTIPYRFDVDGKMHKYICDFYAEILNRDNRIDKYLIEIKPKHQTEKPVMPKKKSQKSMRGYIYESHQYIKNQNKWAYARNFCQQNGMTFKLLNKDNLF
jgi:hypothetical protein